MNEPGSHPEMEQRPRRAGPDPVFTARFVFHEEPAILEKLERAAFRSGHSVAAEIRAAVRYWLDAWETES
jgi:hypothetical protein